MKTKSSNRIYVVTAILSVVVMLLAAAGFINVETQKIDRVSTDTNLVKHAESAGELAVSTGVANTVYTGTAQSAANDSDDALSRMAEELKPVAELNSDESVLNRNVAYLLNNTTANYGATYGEICTAAVNYYSADIDTANHDAAVWITVCGVMALAGVAGLVVSIVKIESNKSEQK